MWVFLALYTEVTKIFHCLCCHRMGTLKNSPGSSDNPLSSLSAESQRCRNLFFPPTSTGLRILLYESYNCIRYIIHWVFLKLGILREGLGYYGNFKAQVFWGEDFQISRSQIDTPTGLGWKRRVLTSMGLIFSWKLFVFLGSQNYLGFSICCRLCNCQIVP